MTYSINVNPTSSEVSEAVNYLLSNLSIGLISNPNSGQITGPTGTVLGYLYKYISIKYADSQDGSVNFSNVPTNRLYYGVRNNNNSIESTNPTDYIWNLSTTGFGSATFLYYLVLGGRQIQFTVATSPPSYKWLVDPGASIDLDFVVPVSTISFNELMDFAVTELKIAASAVTATKINVAALDQSLGNLRDNTVSSSQIVANAVTELKILDSAITANKLGTGSVTTGKIYAGAVTADAIATNAITSGKIFAGAITAVKIEAGAITSEKIYAGSVTADKITVSNLAALSANMGSISAGSLNAVNITGSTITGNTITGGTVSGGVITGGATTTYSSGTGLWSGIDSGTYKFRVGNTSGNNISWDGSTLNIIGGGTFSGALSAASGTFAGSLSAASGSFTGSLSAASGTFSGTLTASAVNAINTINIAGNAVTIPVSAFTSGGVATGSSDVTVQSASIDSQGSPLNMSISFFANSTDPCNGTLTLKRDGTTLLSVSQYFTGGGTVFNYVYSETPSSGSHTYTASFRIDAGTGSASNRSLVLLGTKR